LELQDAVSDGLDEVGVPWHLGCDYRKLVPFVADQEVQHGLCLVLDRRSELEQQVRGFLGKRFAQKISVTHGFAVSGN
jgi:hypothetical protein